MKVAVLNDSSDHTLGQILEGGTFPTVTVQGKAIAISNAQTPTIGAGADQLIMDKVPVIRSLDGDDVSQIRVLVNVTGTLCISFW